jgi:hypothetical protein
LKTFLIAFLTSGIVTLIINSLIKGGITNFYKRKIIEFQDEISKLAERRKFDFERKIHDFSLYSSKRLEVYPILFGKVLFTFERINIYKEIVTIPENLFTNKQHLKNYLESINGINDVIEHYLEHFEIDNQPDNLADNICFSLSKLKLNELNEIIEDTSKYYLTNTLYLSNEVADLVSSINSQFSFMLFYYVSSINKNSSFVDDVYNKSLTTLSGDVNKLKDIMKKEMSLSHYKK